MANEGDPLETLKARLYAPQPVREIQPDALSETRAPRASSWTPPPPPVIKPAKRKLPPSLWFLIIAAGFFIVTAIIAVLFIIFGGRSVSTAHVLIDVQAPKTIASGDTVPLLITIKNDNPVPLNAASITVNLPDGTRNADNTDQALDQYSDSLGDIAPGMQVQRTVRAKLFGAENQQLSIPIHVEYHVTGSTATMVKDQNYAVTVATTPITVNVQTVSQVASGQQVTLRVSVRSNATASVDTVALNAAYPAGFTPTGSNPAPASGSFFALGTFAPGEEKVITITGTLAGSEGEQRAFHFTAGTAKAGSASLDLSYITTDAVIALSKPLLGLTIALNRSNDDAVTAPAGQSVQGSVSWINSLTESVSQAKVTVHFSGNAFDPRSVTAGNGFYRSSDATIVYDQSSNPGLARLQPNDSGNGVFAFTPKSGVRNPNVTLDFIVTGTRANGSTITSTAARTVKIGTGIALASKIQRSGGANPPTPDTPTLYTVTLTAANSINSVGGAVVKAVLPSYVSFTGQTNAGDTSVTYDDAARTVIWNIGTLAASATAQAAFQVSLLPSVSQEGTSPIVIPTQTLTAADQFTQAQVTATADALTSDVIK